MNIKSLSMPAKLTKVFGKQSLLLKKHSPEILLGIGLLGGVTATVFACRATLQAEKAIEEHNKKMAKVKYAYDNKIEGYDDETFRKDQLIVNVQTGVELVRLYTPAITMGVASAICILGAHNIMRRRNVALAAAYKLVEHAFAEYRGRVVEELGAAKDFHFRYGTKEFEILDTSENGEGKKRVKKTVQALDPNQMLSMYARLFEPIDIKPDGSWTGTHQFSKVHDYNYAFLHGKQNWLNDRLNAQGYLFLSDVYDELGFQRTKASQVVGWLKDGNGDGYVSFGKAFDYLAYSDGDPILLDFNVDGNILDYI